MPNCTCDMHGRGGCHCRACCLTFTTVSAFDHHITRGIHQAPAQRGLVLVRPGTWGWADSGRRNELLGARPPDLAMAAKSMAEDAEQHYDEQGRPVIDDD